MNNDRRIDGMLLYILGEVQVLQLGSALINLCNSHPHIISLPFVMIILAIYLAVTSACRSW